MLVFIHDRFSIFSLVTSQIIKSTKGKVVIIQLQASGKSIISMHVSKILFFFMKWVCVWLIQVLNMCHPPSKSCILSKSVEQFPNCFAILSTTYMLGFLISEFGFAGKFCSQPRNAMTLADGLMQYNIALQCIGGCSAGQSNAREKRTEKVRCDECKMTIPILRSIGTQRWFMRLEGVQYLARK